MTDFTHRTSDLLTGVVLLQELGTISAAFYCCQLLNACHSMLVAMPEHRSTPNHYAPPKPVMLEMPLSAISRLSLMQLWTRPIWNNIVIDEPTRNQLSLTILHPAKTCQASSTSSSHQGQCKRHWMCLWASLTRVSTHPRQIRHTKLRTLRGAFIFYRLFQSPDPTHEIWIDGIMSLITIRYPDFTVYSPCVSE